MDNSALNSQNVQDAFLNNLRKDRVNITIYLMGGVKLTGKIRSFDKVSVVLEARDLDDLCAAREYSPFPAGTGSSPGSAVGCGSFHFRAACHGIDHSCHRHQLSSLSPVATIHWPPDSTGGGRPSAKKKSFRQILSEAFLIGARVFSYAINRELFLTRCKPAN